MEAFARLWRMRVHIMLLVILQAFDTLSTVLALGTGGGEEANPVIRAFLGDGGAGTVVLVKWAVVALVFIGVAIDPGQRPYVKAALAIMNTIYAIVLSGNFAVYGMATGNWALPVAFWALVLSFAVVAVNDLFFEGPLWQRRQRPKGGAGSDPQA